MLTRGRGWASSWGNTVGLAYSEEGGSHRAGVKHRKMGRCAGVQQSRGLAGPGDLVGRVGGGSVGGARVAGS